MRRHAVPIVTAVLVTVALTVLWLTPTTAYGPSGTTRCGPALQEWRQTFDDLAGRCHLLRQERMRLGLAMAGLMLLAALPLWLTSRPRGGNPTP